MLIKVTLPLNEKEQDLIHPLLVMNLPKKKIAGKAWLVTETMIIYTNRNNIFRVGVGSANEIPLSKNMPIATYWDSSSSKTNSSVMPIWRYLDNFQQNNLRIHRVVTKFVKQHFLHNIDFSNYTICGIGGEFYRYFVLHHLNLTKEQSDYIKYIGISNNRDILDIARFNLDLYHIPTDLFFVNYNTFTNDLIHNTFICIVNLSVLPLHLFNQLAESQIRFIIIITCNQSIFNRRRHILEGRYKLIDFIHVPQSEIINTGSFVSVYIYQSNNFKRLQYKNLIY